MDQRPSAVSRIGVSRHSPTPAQDRSDRRDKPRRLAGAVEHERTGPLHCLSNLLLRRSRNLPSRNRCAILIARPVGLKCEVHAGFVNHGVG